MKKNNWKVKMACQIKQSCMCVVFEAFGQEAGDSNGVK